jgi:very-short-patch-repair endonuclease
MEPNYIYFKILHSDTYRTIILMEKIFNIIRIDKSKVKKNGSKSIFDILYFYLCINRKITIR